MWKSGGGRGQSTEHATVTAMGSSFNRLWLVWKSSCRRSLGDVSAVWVLENVCALNMYIYSRIWDTSGYNYCISKIKFSASGGAFSTPRGLSPVGVKSCQFLPYFRIPSMLLPWWLESTTWSLHAPLTLPAACWQNHWAETSNTCHHSLTPVKAITPDLWPASGPPCYYLQY